MAAARPNTVTEVRDDEIDYYYVSNYSFKFTEKLLRQETTFPWMGRPFSDLKSARSHAITWILQTTGRIGFHVRTAYLSVIYLDRYLSRTWVPHPDDDIRAFRLLSVACISLAAKMEQGGKYKFAIFETKGYSFPADDLLRMEFRVLDALDWKMMYITPFSYLSYFITKFSIRPSRNQKLLIRAAEFICTILPEINLVDHLSSTVAAAAVLAASSFRYTKPVLRAKMKRVPLWGSVEKEQTISCYCLLGEVLTSKTPESTVSPDPDMEPEADSTSTMMIKMVPQRRIRCPICKTWYALDAFQCR